MSHGVDVDAFDTDADGTGVHMLPGGLVPSASAWTLLATTEISGLNNNDSGLNDGT